MDILYSYHDRLLRQVSDFHFRFLYDRIHWDQHMLAIKGPRGAGKTTLLLQYLRYKLNAPADKALYVTADHHWFYTHNLLETAEEFYINGGRYLFIDEVHKYPRWSRELKNIYDGFPDMQVVFSASSALDIYRGEADLSRRVITYDLPGLSFREYLMFTGHGTFPAIPFEDLARNHRSLAVAITNKFHPLPLFRKYLRYGYLPLFLESAEEEIPLRLGKIINAVLESDLAFIENYGAGSAHKVKKLLGVVAESVPFKPNIAALARKLDVSRDSIYTWFNHLQKARLLNLLQRAGKGISLLQKPDKIYLENTNLAFALKPDPDTGSLRETFLLNQLVNAGLKVTKPKSGDFYVRGTAIETGGKGKTSGQVDDYPDYLIAADDIEAGFQKKIPLWLFGFLY